MKSVLILLLVLTCVEVFAQEPVDSRQKEIVIRDVNVVPMDAEKVLRDQTVIIKDGKVSAIGSKLKHSKGALIIDGKDKYLIPGLAEMHAHVPPIDDIEPMKEVLILFAANGITTIRGMLGHPKHLELRSKIRSGEILGPELFTTGPSFNGMSVTSPEAGAEMVRKQKEAGYDFLKLHPGLTKAKFDAIASTAHEVGIPFVGHVSSGVGVWHACESRYSSIDHLDGFVEGLVPGIEKMTDQEAGLFGMFVADQADTTKIPELMASLKGNRIWVVPTQSLAERWFSPSFPADDFRKDPHAKYMKKNVVDQWISSKKNLQENAAYDSAKIIRYIQLRRTLIKSCQQNGIGLLLGCDAPQVFNVPGFSTHDELKYIVDAGLTPYQALRTGTVNVSQYLHRTDEGVIKPGNVANLVLISGNPLEDISYTKKIEGVMMRGKWLSREYLDKELKKLEK
jgi:imidazolonepropionase-like amidohydrolase